MGYIHVQQAFFLKLNILVAEFQCENIGFSPWSNGLMHIMFGCTTKNNLVALRHSTEVDDAILADMKFYDHQYSRICKRWDKASHIYSLSPII